MAFYSGNENDRKDYRQRDDEDFRNSVYRIDSRSPKLEDEKKMRREIANSNERRRMQSINAGFQSLRALLPKGEGDKLSKAAILQGTVDYVQQLEQEKSFLLSQNLQLSRSVHSCNDSDGSYSDMPLPKRKRRKQEVDEGIGSASPSSQSEGEERQELVQLRQQLQQERAARARLEGEIKEMRHSTEQQLSSKAPRAPHRKNPQSRLTLQEHEIALVPPSGNDPPAERPPVVPSPPQPSKSAPVAYPYDRPRQSLAAIVEAIRHVEGYHMFQDDPPPRSSPSPCNDRPFQVIRSAPPQNRAGVIVSNTS